MAIKKTKIFMIAGEPSGDALGGELMKTLKAKKAECVGIGGVLMAEQGLKSITPMSELCVMGIWEVVMQLPRLLKLIKGIVEEIEMAQPDVLVTIDLPDFNFRVAKQLKKRGIFKGKIVHYVAPSVWAWRPGRAKKVSKFLDGIMCLFPFEPQYFEEHGLSAKYVGHPLVLQNPNKAVKKSFRDLCELNGDGLVFGVYLGSREAEIEKHKEVFNDAVGFLLEKHPELQVIMPTFPELEYNAINAMTGVQVHPVVIRDQRQKWEAMRACDVAMAVSGTVGLELSYMNVPHVVAYKAHPITALIVRLLIRVRFVHLANILLDKPAVPEFLQGRCKSLPIALELEKLLEDKELLKEQKVAFSELRTMLKDGVDGDPSELAANYIINL